MSEWSTEHISDMLNKIVGRGAGDISVDGQSLITGHLCRGTGEHYAIKSLKFRPGQVKRIRVEVDEVSLGLWSIQLRGRAFTWRVNIREALLWPLHHNDCLQERLASKAEARAKHQLLPYGTSVRYHIAVIGEQFVVTVWSEDV